ncbi:MAG: Translation initiation factor IF-3 [Microgenomates group bacterium GW2011_GWA2_44_7]|uniref:Translation initiation factor IF-3 n=1 Tax=Candidatus Woesebacteria bacterium GW2011_GWA1_43_12 TaxID=1618557 RepID=A0A0G1F5A8_9BACT|nr:MAG: Translation initiation factor IF-3 [Candidatus Woesebacteria bacterium GW2011_GWA1_43_12]KKT76246.1 MAG: Translation initiation factor IF-3 [Microgenomates group bacterium GW2011_GWA2_44_7]KKT77720.1 MAG: Translation initiation factor IF-3 [Microgenomates group bacterium GW2011_GWB1_44_8]
MTLAAIKVYRLNNQITASPVRLISSDGKQIGVVPIEEARKMAEESNQDLVEISGEAQPPVIKLIDFKKFRYQEAKKEREAAKKVKKVDLKEVRLTPFMAEGDFRVKVERMKEFITEGNKVRITVRFTGRQMGKTQFGFIIMKKAFDALADYATVDQMPKLIGRQIIAVMTPAKKG